MDRYLVAEPLPLFGDKLACDDPFIIGGSF